MHTLIADDNSEVRAALLLLLRELSGRDIVEASSMAEALRACEESGPGAAPELVLLDWELPAGTFGPAGPAAFVTALREAAPTCRIIAMSARPEAEEESLRAGCDAFVSRTDPPDRLVGLLAALAAPEDPALPD
jgi:CheY-like chemotaxis protein